MKQIKTFMMFCVSALVSCVVRVCQLLFMTDPANGFFYPRYEAMGTALTVLYVAMFVATALVAYSEMRGTIKMTAESKVRTYILFVAGLSVAAELLSFSPSGGPLGVLVLLLTLGCAAFFFIEATYSAAESRVPENLRQWMCVFPVCFWLAQTVMAFSQYMTVANIAENIFDLCAMGLLTLFFLLYGKTANKIGTSATIKLLTPLGLCASLLCFICSIPRYAAQIFAEYPIHGISSPRLLFVVMGVAILFLLPRRIKQS